MVEQLREKIRYGQSTLLIGGRRTGKTTLARRVAIADVERKVIFTDVAGWDLTSQATGLGALQSAVQGVPETRHKSAIRDDLIQALEEMREFVLIIDEADRLLQADWGPDFFSFLRWMDDTRYRTRVSIMLIGGPVLAQFRDPKDRGSPPLNYADFELMEPLDLPAIMELNAMLPNPVDPDLLLSWTGGNAWLANQLLARLWHGKEFHVAAEEVHDRAAMTVFPVWQRQAGHRCLELLRAIPGDGVDRQRILGGDLSQYREPANSGRCVGVLRLDGDRLKRGPQPFVDWLESSSAPSEIWDLAISYASEDVSVAREIYEQLRTRFRVFFAPHENGALWGTDLYRVLPNTYGVSSRFTLVLSTTHYVGRYWTRIEFLSVAQTHPERILFLDMGGLPDRFPTGSCTAARLRPS